MEDRFVNWKKNIVIFISSQQFSMFGSSVSGFVVIWYVTLSTSSGKAMTAITLATFIPQIFISFLGGVWADRYNKKLLIMASDLFIAAVTLILAIYFILGGKALGPVLIVSALRSIGSGIQAPAVQSMLPQIAPMEKLVRINGINSTLNSVFLLLSPAVGGIVLGTLGVGYGLMIDVVSAVIAVIIFSFLRIREKKAVEDIDKNKKAGPLTEIKEGLVYTKNHPFLLRLLVIYAIIFFLITPASFLTPILVERSFGGEVWRLTVNEIAFTIGSLLGGAFVAIRGSFQDKFHALFFSIIGFGVTFALLGTVGSFWIYIGIMVVSGIFMPVFSTADTVLIQETVEEAMMGRVFSIVQIIASASMPIGMLVFGPLGDLIKIEYILICTGAAMALVSPFILKCKKTR